MEQKLLFEQAFMGTASALPREWIPGGGKASRCRNEFYWNIGKVLKFSLCSLPFTPPSETQSSARKDPPVPSCISINPLLRTVQANGLYCNEALGFSNSSLLPLQL